MMPKTTAEIAHHARVAALPCVLCQALGMEQTTPTQVHHVRDGQGMQQRASHWLVAALCWDCHQGPRGIHGDRGRMVQAKAGELDLLALTLARIMQA